MNKPPAHFERVSSDALRTFVTSVFNTEGMSQNSAALLSHLLVTNDERGVFSHGTRQARAYTEHFRERRLTPNPTLTTIRETATTLTLDGGGGLGYFPCLDLVNRLVEKAKVSGVAVGTTTNHGHFGAAGIYARIPLPSGFLSIVTSGHQLHLEPGRFVMDAAGGSPWALGIPTGDEPPFVLDFGAIHDLYGGPESVSKIMDIAPSSVLRSFGLGCACQALGGFLCGVPLDEYRAQRQWAGANQGSFMVVVDVNALYPIDAFRQEMDEYARRVRAMQPLPGMAGAYLPGGMEWEQVKVVSEEGISIGPEHAAILGEIAELYGISSPVTRIDPNRH